MGGRLCLSPRAATVGGRAGARQLRYGKYADSTRGRKRKTNHSTTPDTDADGRASAEEGRKSRRKKDSKKEDTKNT